jgi:DNA repair photolyase
VHLDALLFCEFACVYCSSNSGLHLKFSKRTINAAVNAVTGKEFDPHNAAQIVIGYRDLVQRVDAELSDCRRKPGAGKTLVYSQLTDGFSPVLLKTGIARQLLDLILEKTEYRIRVLTKNAVVGQPEWLRYFSAHRERFVVGLSTGMLDDSACPELELRTSKSESRIKALHGLQDAGVPTFGMLCPVMPHVSPDELDRLIDAIRPEKCEKIWAEPFNDRENWRKVRDCYGTTTRVGRWLTRVYEDDEKSSWSRYATDLYEQIYRKAEQGGWSAKLRYLLYESDISAEDAPRFQNLDVVLLQCVPDKSGRSRNPQFANRQIVK